jgi:hypothetical protein
MKKKRSVYLIFIALFVLIFIYGCNWFGTNSEEPVIFVEISGSNSAVSVRAFIENSPGDPIVTINGDTLTEKNIGDLTSWGVRFSQEIPIDPEEEYELIVSHDLGEAHAQITMPSNSAIITPSNNDTLKLNEDLVLNWTSSDNMERYILCIDIHHLNTVNPVTPYDWNRFNFIVDTTDTSIIIPNEDIFSPDPDSAKYGFGTIMLKSENGPSIRSPLDIKERNISGDGVGYFVATNYADSSTHIRIGTDTLESDTLPFFYIPCSGEFHDVFNRKLNILYYEDPLFR